jgi:hypothetical protein
LRRLPAPEGVLPPNKTKLDDEAWTPAA